MMGTDDVRWLRRHAMITPFGAAVTTWLLSALVGGGPWLFWHDLEPAQAMAGLGTITWGMAAILAEGGIKLVFWAIDERRRKLTEREIDTLLEARERLKQGQDTYGIAVMDDMIEDRRRNPLRIRRGRRR